MMTDVALLKLGSMTHLYSLFQVHYQGVGCDVCMCGVVSVMCASARHCMRVSALRAAGAHQG